MTYSRTSPSLSLRNRKNLMHSFIAAIIGIATAICFSIPYSVSQKTPSATIETVHIFGKKMNPEQKMAFDLEQSGNTIQTVIITSHRMSAEEKLALDQQQKIATTSMNTIYRNRETYLQ
ncbi:hypothetical protein [Undibacterium sp. SXout7W]|uniref:hypothetical protein n=1 Tax=Undibacterium sp. SXout7W TaxID=3413049 RepID=UPI003BF60781